MDFKIITNLFADSSSLIILEKSGLLALLKDHFSCYTIADVKQETLKKSKMPDQKRFKDFNIFFNRVHVILLSPHIGTVDQKLLKTFIQYIVKNPDKKMVMLTDDRKIIEVLIRKELPFINALLIPVILYKRDIISIKEAYSFIEEIKKNAYYAKGIIDWAMNELD